MRRSDTRTIGSLIADFIKEQGLEQGLLAVNIYNALAMAVGENYAGLLSGKSYKDKCLYCRVNSSVARSVLYNNREEIIRKINEIIGKDVVEKLILR